MVCVPLRLPLPLLFSLLMLTASSGCSGSEEPADGGGDGDVGGDGDGDTPPPVGDGDGDAGGDGDTHPPVGGDGDATEPPETCEFEGAIYESGETFNSECNTCTCMSGSVACTLRACPEPIERCALPFDTGNCDALLSVYWHNPTTGQCEPEFYGGCGGNDNRFATLEECSATCGGEPSGSSCEVDGVVYPDGATNVPDPASCNTCSCLDGEVSGCTKIGCPIECEEGSELGSDCAECGPADECFVVRTGCLPTCEISEDCAASGGWLCHEGLCRNFCG